MNSKDNPLEVFYAEDKKTERLLFELALFEIPIPVQLTMVNNGKEAMNILLDHDTYRPDLIFLNLTMPLKSGTACLEEIRKHKRFDHTPVIIFSISNNEKYIKETYDLKANLYVQKPFNITSQIEYMKKILTLDWKKYFPQPPKEKYLFPQDGAATHKKNT